MADTACRFAREENMHTRVHNLAVTLIRPLIREDLLLAPWLYFHHDSSEFQSFLNEHFQLNKARITLCAYRDADWKLIGLPADVTWEVAPCYGTKYFVSRVPISVGVCPELGRLMLPQSNPFIPKDLSILPHVPQVRTIFYRLHGILCL